MSPPGRRSGPLATSGPAQIVDVPALTTIVKVRRISDEERHRRRVAEFGPVIADYLEGLARRHEAEWRLQPLVDFEAAA